MNLEPIMQREVSQKEKNKYHRLKHRYGIQKNGIDEPVCREGMEMQISSVQFSRSVMSNSATAGAATHLAFLCITNSQSLLKLMCIESVMPFNHLFLCHPLLHPPSIFPISGSFPMSQLFPSGGQIIEVLASASVFPMNIQDSFPLGLTGWISLQSKGLSKVFSNTTVQIHHFFGTQLSLQSNSHPYMTAEKATALTRRTFVGKVMSLLFNMLSRLVITFLPRSQRLLISWLQSPSAVILEPPKIKYVTVSSPICHEVMVPDAMILVF